MSNAAVSASGNIDVIMFQQKNMLRQRSYETMPKCHSAPALQALKDVEGVKYQDSEIVHGCSLRY